MPPQVFAGAFSWMASKKLERFYIGTALKQKDLHMSLSTPPISSIMPTGTGTPITPGARTDAPRFGKESSEPSDRFSPQEQEEAPRDFSTAERLKGACKGALKAIFRPRSLMMDTLFAVVITVATAWLPGSQLLTIPAYLAISAALRAVPGAIHGYQSPHGTPPQKDSRLLMFPVSS
jgi:hypothetical protein